MVMLTRCRFLVVIAVLAVFSLHVNALTVVKKTVSVPEKTGKNLINPVQAVMFDKGFVKTGDEFLCDNGSDSTASRGVSFQVTLNQTTPAPIIAEGWSRAENTDGSASSDYSLYLDIVYADGTNQWGVNVPFSVGTHTWEFKRLTFVPDAPVKSLGFNALFRNKKGRVTFKDLKLFTTETQQDVVRFDDIPIEPLIKKPEKRISCLLRDVTAKSDFARLEPETFGIKSSIEITKLHTGSGTSTLVTLQKPAAFDRCLTLYFIRHCNDIEKKWFCRIRQKEEPKGEMSLPANRIQSLGGAKLSKYPLIAVTGRNKENKSVGRSIGIDLMYPAFFRLGYNEKTDELYAAVDLALTEESPKAVLRFVEFEFDAADGFRGALAEYYKIFPGLFHRRISEQGNWMPFAPISKIKDFADFGFRFKEGNDEPDWDDAHNILTFRYTEPMTWWMPMSESQPKTYEAALNTVRELAEKGEADAKAGAAAFLNGGGMKNIDGRYAHVFQDTPWCNGVVWSMCDIPGIENGSYHTKWNKELAEKLYGTINKSKEFGVDGEYVDSSEGYITTAVDYDRSHFSAAKYPLVFNRETFRPGIFRGLVAYEYVRSMSEDIHARKKLMMANSTPDGLCWLAPFLDVMGTETNWNHAKWRPMSDEDMMYRRILCQSKPYCFLMNTDFTKWTYEMTEKYMKRTLFYGMFPGFFSADASTGHYFTRPELYERDRPLFQKYMPLCKEVAEAGWQPLTGASVSAEKVYIERFGKETEPQQSIFTVFNDSEKRQDVVIRFEPKNFMPFPQRWKNKVDGRVYGLSENTLVIRLDPENTAMLVPEK